MWRCTEKRLQNWAMRAEEILCKENDRVALLDQWKNSDSRTVPRKHKRFTSRRTHSHFTPPEQFVGRVRTEHRQRPSLEQAALYLRRPQLLRPQSYNTLCSEWTTFPGFLTPLGSSLHDSILKIVTWNLDWRLPDPATRATAAMRHLESLFTKRPGLLVVMLQEVCLESLEALRNDQWVQENFVMTDSDLPKSIHNDDVEGDSFIMRVNEALWRPAPHFTVMLLPKTLRILGCFRVPLVTAMGRDALIVDIPVSDEPRARKAMRLCTTHLESLHGAYPCRFGQLAMISTLLKEPRISEHENIAGVVGGDMSALEFSDQFMHEKPRVELRDIWEDAPKQALPKLEPGKEDSTYGRARGNTFGYQSQYPGLKRRLSKFFYTGKVDSIALSKPLVQDVTGRLGRMGIGCKTEVEAWMLQRELESTVYGRKVFTKHNEILSDIQVSRVRVRNRELLEKIRPVITKSWVSGHFGIAVGIRIRG